MHDKGIQLLIVLEYLSVGILEGIITKTVPSYWGLSLRVSVFSFDLLKVYEGYQMDLYYPVPRLDKGLLNLLFSGCYT